MIRNNPRYFLFRTVLPVFLGLVLFAYILARAILLPVTHDESNTCITYAALSVHDIVTYAIPIPNNHILNTLLVKFFISIFGMHPLPVRLPNVIGFALYFTIICLFTRKISNNPFVTFFGIAAMTCNPYLLDFFSLARGYALSISFMMTSLYFAYLFLEKPKNTYLSCSIFFGVLAVYTNFTTLNFYAALVIVLGLVTLQQKYLLRKEKPHFLNSLVSQWGIIITGTMLLAAVSYLPISKMVATDQFVFWGSNGFYTDTILSLVKGLQYNVQYFGVKETGFSYLIIGFAAIISIVCIWVLVKIKGKIAQSAQVFFFLIFGGTITINILQFHLVHTPYLTSRTALFFFPLMSINFIFFAEWLRAEWPGSAFFFSLPLSLLTIIHFLRAANFYSCFEWWYDADTYTILQYLEKERINSHGQISLNTSWIFFPSFDFHVISENKDWIKLAPFHKDVQPDSSYQYYYATGDDKPALESNYDSVLSLGWDTRFLMKRKK